jgi:hypothetical protein
MKNNHNIPWKKLDQVWIADNPQSDKIIQFIGSFIFGSCPLNSYKYLLEFLYQKGYSLIIYRFPFNPFGFNHWQISFQLLKQQYQAREYLIKKFHKLNDSHSVNKYLDNNNYSWLGHSLGCKYLILLEILSPRDFEQTKFLLKECQVKEEKLINQIKNLETTREKINKSLTDLLNQKVDIKPFILDQKTIFLAPEISNTVGFLGLNFQPTDFFVFPNRGQTKCLVKNSQNLFNLTKIIAFKFDNIARDDVNFLGSEISKKTGNQNIVTKLWGWHFEPLSIYIEDIVKEICSHLS